MAQAAEVTLARARSLRLIRLIRHRGGHPDVRANRLPRAFEPGAGATGCVGVNAAMESFVALLQKHALNRERWAPAAIVGIEASNVRAYRRS